MQRRAQIIAAAAGAVLLAVLLVAVTVRVTSEDGARPGDRFVAGNRMHGTSTSSEYDYLAEMVAHHEEAVASARELERSDRAEMRAFGEGVIASQSAQIDQMRQWLTEWYPDRSGEVDYEPMMRDLSGLSGARLDRAFLQDMVGHHMGAVMMSQQLLRRGVADHVEVEDLAVAIRDEQHAEIFQMQEWLRDWFDADWRHGMPGMTGMSGRQGMRGMHQHAKNPG